MRYLGVDYGDVRTGLALSDPSGLLASGIGYVKESGMRHTAVKVAEEARARGAEGIVVGYPKNMDGSEGPRTEVVRAFVALLQGDFMGAVEYNAYVVLGLPFALAFAARRAYVWIKNGDDFSYNAAELAFLILAFLLMVAFVIIRNIPQFAFLAP